jgi:plastocyanin
MMRKTLYVIALMVLVLSGMISAISCGTSSPSVTPTPDVKGTQVKPTEPGANPGPDFKPASVAIENFAFSPATLTVPIGTTVTWTNNDSAAHTVTSRTQAFDSGKLSQGQSYSFTFNQKGDFEYYCTFHPNMTGKVSVE